MADLRFFYLVLAQIFTYLSHGILRDDRDTALSLKLLRCSCTVGKVSLSCVKQQAVLRALLLKYFLKLIIGQQLLLLQFKLLGVWKMFLHAFYKLLCNISRGIHQHHTHCLRACIHHTADRADDQLLFKYQIELPSLFISSPIDQTIINTISTFLPAVTIADQPCL